MNVPAESSNETLGQAEALPAQQVEYLLKELEFQVAFENKARDRTEQMVSYLLTFIAAILGAVLLIAEAGTDPLLVASIASALVLAFFVSYFYRSCRLHSAITHARIYRRLIRGALVEVGVKQAGQMGELEGPPAGFSPRVWRNLVGLATLCGLLGGLTFVLGAAQLGVTPAPDDPSWANGGIALLGFAVIFIPLAIILRYYSLDAIHLAERHTIQES